MAIFQFFEDGGRRHFGFSNFRVFNSERSRGSSYDTVPNFVVIGQTIAEIW